MVIAASGPATFHELSACSLDLGSLAVELRALWNERGHCEDADRRAQLLRQYHVVYAEWDRAYTAFHGACNAYFAREAELAVGIRGEYAQRTQTGA